MIEMKEWARCSQSEWCADLFNERKEKIGTVLIRPYPGSQRQREILLSGDTHGLAVYLSNPYRDTYHAKHAFIRALEQLNHNQEARPKLSHRKPGSPEQNPTVAQGSQTSLERMYRIKSTGQIGRCKLISEPLIKEGIVTRQKYDSILAIEVVPGEPLMIVKSSEVELIENESLEI
jgi:hypothetical protein